MLHPRNSPRSFSWKPSWRVSTSFSWLVGEPISLWKIWRIVSWDDDIPNVWKVIIQMFFKAPIIFYLVPSMLEKILAAAPRWPSSERTFSFERDCESFRAARGCCHQSNDLNKETQRDRDNWISTVFLTSNAWIITLDVLPPFLDIMFFLEITNKGGVSQELNV